MYESKKNNSRIPEWVFAIFYKEIDLVNILGWLNFGTSTTRTDRMTDGHVSVGTGEKGSSPLDAWFLVRADILWPNLTICTKMPKLCELKRNYGLDPYQILQGNEYGQDLKLIKLWDL